MKKKELMESCIYCLLISISLGIASALNYLEIKYFFYCLLVWMWPVEIFLKNSFFKRLGNHLFLWSAIGWMSCTVMLILINVITYDNVIWCVFPIIGILLWPISTLVKIKMKEG